MDEWTRLAIEARGGDEAALAVFVRVTQADVWRLCAHLGDREHADDLTQETYLRIFRGWHSFRGEGSVRSWIFSIVRRVVADDISARQRRRTQQTADKSVEGSDAQETVALQMLVDALDSDRRAAFWLTQVVGFSYAEAAEFCGCPVGTIRSRVARAREDLLGMLAAPVQPRRRPA